MNNRLVALDGLRGIAALCVFLYHAQFIPFLPRVANGYLAVDLFFLISGFILAKVYIPRFASGLSIWIFARSRFWRFYPLYFLGFALGLSFAVAREAFGRGGLHYGLPWSAVFSAGMLPAFNLMGTPTTELYPFNGPSWSLLFEFILNIVLLPLLITSSLRNVYLLLAILFIIVSAYTIMAGTINIGFAFYDAFFGLLRSAFSFSFGVALFRWPPRADWLPKAWVVPLATILFLAPDIEPGLIQALYDLAFVGIIGPVIMLSSINVRILEGIIYTIYEFLGRLSYAIYAVHVPIIYFAKAILDRVGIFEPKPLAMMSISFVLAVSLFSIAAMLIDERLQRWFRGRFRREAVA